MEEYSNIDKMKAYRKLFNKFYNGDKKNNK